MHIETGAQRGREQQASTQAIAQACFQLRNDTDRFRIEVPDKDAVVLRAADDECLAWMRHEGRKQAM